MRFLLLCLPLLCHVHSFKFLVYSPQYEISHANFIGRLTDVLVDAGHEVVMVSPIIIAAVNNTFTEKARIIEIPQCAYAAEFEQTTHVKMSENFWVQNVVQMIPMTGSIFENKARVCESVVSHPGLIEQLKQEKFDAAFSESIEACGPVLFHLAGIDKWAVTESMANTDGGFYITQTPGNPSYVPSLMSGAGDQMSFIDRLSNVMSFAFVGYFMQAHHPVMEQLLMPIFPELPSINDIIATNSLVFLNSEPLVDFPKLTSARVIDIGGITTWSDIFDLRPHTILVSFGTVALAHAMPEEYKRTIRETIKLFPDKPEHNISAGTTNLHESTWIPQRDLLRDHRLTAFLTHCGQGSTTEAIDAGIPLIVIPVVADQDRNARQIERNGMGVRLQKTDLSGGDRLEKAIREVIENDSYRKRAERISKTIADRPFAMKEIFARNMEFLAKHGPLRQLDHYGRHLNFVQYYLIDVIGFLLLIATAICMLVMFAVRSVWRRVFLRKAKKE